MAKYAGETTSSDDNLTQCVFDEGTKWGVQHHITLPPEVDIDAINVRKRILNKDHQDAAPYLKYFDKAETIFLFEYKLLVSDDLNETNITLPSTEGTYPVPYGNKVIAVATMTSPTKVRSETGGEAL